MAKEIKISPAKREARAKAAQMELCWTQREQQIHKYQSRNPFSNEEWIAAFMCGWLRQHGLGYWSFPSPPAHLRKQWETSDEDWYKLWRAESKIKHKSFRRKLK